MSDNTIETINGINTGELPSIDCNPQSVGLDSNYRSIDTTSFGLQNLTHSQDD